MTHRVHLDYASSAPLRDGVRAAMTQCITRDFFDPRRLYEDAISSRYEIENHRVSVAQYFGADPSEVVFTGSSSESLAMFAHGVIRSENANVGVYDHVVTTPLDSTVISETWLRNNCVMSVAPIDSAGIIDIAKLVSIVTPDTRAVSLAYAHPDTGVIQPLHKLITAIRVNSPQCLIHVDARNAAGYAPLSFHNIEADMMTVEAVTFGGPSGVGALLVRSGLLLRPLIPGATQERARRSGLENILGIKGFGVLCELRSQATREDDHIARIRSLVLSSLEKNHMNILSGADTLPHYVSFSIPDVAASAVVAELNRLGVNVHAGSSCGSEEFEPSPALLALGMSNEEAETVVRVSWGYATSEADIEEFARALGEISSIFPA